MKRYYNFVLTESQIDFLAESKNGVNIMKVLTVLLKHTCTDSGYDYARPGWNSYLHSGQTLISDADLAEFCNCDVETVSDIIRMLNNSGLISTMSNSSVSIHTLLFLDEIHDKGKTVFNSRCQDQRLREEESIYQTQMALKYAEVKVDDNMSQISTNHAMDKAFEFMRRIEELNNNRSIRDEVIDNLNEMGDK